MEELLTGLATQGPLVGLLVIAILYFLKREKLKEAEIVKLNEELREVEKEHLVLMNKFLVYLDKIEGKIDELKNKNNG